MLLPFSVFLAVGVVVSVLRADARYLALFGMLGAAGAVGSQAQRLFGLRLLAFRRMIHWALAAFFFGYMMMVVGLNFHLSQAFFDTMAGVAAAALIQLIVARVIVPFFFGNAFCSTVCWNGAVFDMLPHRGRRALPAWALRVPYAVILATLALAVALHGSRLDPSTSAPVRRWWVLGENGVILLVGIGLAPALGGRVYCRGLCPFHAVSRLFARWSIGKIGLKAADACTQCGACDAVCPFEVPVSSYVAAGQRVLSRECILCEKCVAACPNGVLGLTLGRPWQ